MMEKTRMYIIKNLEPEVISRHHKTSEICVLDLEPQNNTNSRVSL